MRDFGDSFLVLDESIHTQQPALRFHDRPRPRWGAHHRDDARALTRCRSTNWARSADHRRNLAKRASYDGNGEHMVTYIIDRNINYTNVCNVYCKFCAFYRTEKDGRSLRPDARPDRPELDELNGHRRHPDSHAGGHHPKLDLDWYLTLLAHIRAKYPHINIHGFSPPEFCHFAEIFGMPVREVLQKFKEAGLGSCPGRWRRNPRRSRARPHRAAEMQERPVARRDARGACPRLELQRDDDVRPRRNRRTTASSISSACVTPRMKPVDSPPSICWTLPARTHQVHAEPVGSSEYLRMQALSRIYLDNFENVQSSWVTQGPASTGPRSNTVPTTSAA